MPCDQIRIVSEIDLGKIDRARLARALADGGCTVMVKHPGSAGYAEFQATDPRPVVALYSYVDGVRFVVDDRATFVHNGRDVEPLAGRVRQLYAARTVTEVATRFRAQATTKASATGVKVTVKVGR